MSSEDLLAKFGSENRWRGLHVERIKKAVQAQCEDTLVLDPRKDTDPAREYLAECGLRLKAAWAVLKHVRKMWNERPEGTLTAGNRKSANALIAQCATDLDGKTIYKIPRFVLEFTADHAKQHRRETDLQSWHKHKKRRKAALKKSGKKNFRKSSAERVG